MKLRLKPLRGQTYEINGRKFKFIEKAKVNAELVEIYSEETGLQAIVDIEILNLPIIDTKDYEKIPDEKYRGD